MTDAGALHVRHAFIPRRPSPTPRGARDAEVQAICERYAARPKGWLVLSGSYGCGKTHLAYAVAGVLLNARRPVYIPSVPQLLQTLREGYDKASREEVGDGARALRGQTCEERLALIQTAGLLILDDLGAEYRTPWVADTLRIVDSGISASCR